ncbi:MAG: trimeric intracellular cation channel family protein [Saprospiraceae bacterium]|nr:trimeric intracellular cation channel family protein [Saprospiraceae bacterium]
MIFKEVLEILGTASFAISGALAALNKRLDVFGVLIITFATAVGGGTIRDVMIGNTPVAWMKDQTAIRTIFISYVLTLIFQRLFKKLPLTLTIFDAIGLGFATIVGLQRGLEAQLSPAICITLGMVTGCFGGVVRDVLLNEIPLVFRKDIYASASLLGGLLYFLFSGWEMFAPLATSLSILAVVLLRLVVVRFGWRLPDLSRRDDL